jgi:hypothetical protein
MMADISPLLISLLTHLDSSYNNFPIFVTLIKNNLVKGHQRPLDCAPFSFHPNISHLQFSSSTYTSTLTKFAEGSSETMLAKQSPTKWIKVTKSMFVGQNIYQIIIILFELSLDIISHFQV